MSGAAARSMTLFIEPIAVSPSEAARLAGVGRTTIYSSISAGELRSIKVGKRRLIAVDALREWLRRRGQGMNERAVIETAMSGRRTHQRRPAGVRIVLAWELPSDG